ncbi:hypothetical protein ACLOAV_002196 [Pseudogymnoascus australis]
MAKAQEPEASQLAESQITQAETTRTTDQLHHEETPEETEANNEGQTETSPPAAVTATEVIEEQLPPLAEPGESDDADSAYGDSVASSSTSLASSITRYQYENGRRYHAYKQGEYYLPNDEMEQDLLDLQHHIYRLCQGGSLFCAPIKEPQSVLDIGTGTGIWAMEFADEFPGALVIGTDLSPISQPTVELFYLQIHPDKDTTKITYHVDIKSEMLRDALRNVLKDAHAVSTKENNLSVEQDLLYHYIPELETCQNWNGIDVQDQTSATHVKKELGLVAVFLRKLEYCEGILFLTTNRVSQFDEAILSRVHITLRYDDLDKETKEQIWKQFLDRANTSQGPANVSRSELKRFTAGKYNGRQIKNIVATAHALATKQRCRIRFEHLQRAVAINERFVREFYGKDYADSVYN